MQLNKGDPVKALWWQSSPVSLSGVMPKLGATPRSLDGVVTHIHGNHPVNPTEIMIRVQDESGQEHSVQPEWLTEINGNPIGLGHSPSA